MSQEMSRAGRTTAEVVGAASMSGAYRGLAAAAGMTLDELMEHVEAGGPRRCAAECCGEGCASAKSTALPNRNSSTKGWPVTSRCGAAGLSEGDPFHRLAASRLTALERATAPSLRRRSIRRDP
jgi:hypothetical protein